MSAHNMQALSANNAAERRYTSVLNVASVGKGFQSG